MRRFDRVASVSLCLALSGSIHGQGPLKAPIAFPTEEITLGQSIFALNGPWKFHVGDDPAWANPDFDDSQWETVDLTPKSGAFDPTVGFSDYVRGWTTRGHPGYWGYAWYRIRVQVNARPEENLALVGPTNIDDVYQVFGNGVLLGSFGKFPSHGQPPVAYNTQPMMFHFPSAQTASPSMLVLAFRVWMAPNDLLEVPDAGGFHSAPLLGNGAATTANYQLAWLENVRAFGSSAIEAVLFFLLAIMTCSLVLFDRTDRVYWWLAGIFLLTAIVHANLCLVVWTQVESARVGTFVTDIFAFPLTLGGWVMVWWAWFRLQRPSWVTKAVGLLTLLYMISDALGEDLFFVAIPHQVAVILRFVSLASRLLFLSLLVLIVIWGVRKQGTEGWLALPAVVLVGISQFQTVLSILHLRTSWFPFGLQMNLSQFAEMILVIVLFILLVRRLLLSVRRQREMALDVKQAQEVQRVLLPETLNVPGLRIETEYRPAREVGGDFFQIVPHPTDGSVLIVAGDVAGKGLQAGMLVAMLVGAIRTAVETSAEPEYVLDALNRRLLSRGSANATCLGLRIDSDGGVTLVNAGSLPPYLNGVEIPMEGALPLGTIPGAEFSVSYFQIGKGDTLTLISDGILEAQDKEGHLFGFERVADLLRTKLSAAALATAAQLFGQEDDISVVSVTRVPFNALPIAN